MREKRQSSHVEEFQIIYVDTLPARQGGGSITSHSFSVGCTQRFPSKEYSMEWGWKKSNFTVEKSGKHCLSQMIKINIAVISHVYSTYPWYDIMRMALNLSGLPPPKDII